MGAYDYSTAVYTDYNYEEFIPEPSPFILTINNRYPSATQKTVLQFEFDVDIDLLSQDEIELTFDTHNLLLEMFKNDVEG
jgi:hypothetical protein